jgi:ribonucleoside-diphosphate reductase alpha chain
LVSKSFLESLKFSLQCLGCNEIVISETKSGYKLKIGDIDLSKLYSHGVKIKNFTVTPDLDNYSELSVVSVEDLGRKDSTYCFTEEKRGMGVFNGVLTGNCAEVMLASGPEKEEIAVCNIATISLPRFVTLDKQFDFKKLEEIVKVITFNLNNVIDVNFYPVKETENSNKKHRPIIIGTQGLANLFFELKIPFESKEAEELNLKIFETIQYSALKASNELAKIYGPYSTFHGSPSSKGIFQHNMWGKSNDQLSGRHDWDSLKESVKLYGLRNCLLTGSPPTASTSQILGNYESFEPVTNNFLIRKTLSGEFPVINKYLILDLLKLNLWDQKMKNKILSEKGSIQEIKGIPDDIKKIYKTVWEISQKTLINLSRDRGLFTDHSQSLNIYIKNPNIGSLTSMHFYGWRQGLKTGMYYCRSKSTAEAIDITLVKEQEQLQCSLENRENCDMCSG